MRRFEPFIQSHQATTHQDKDPGPIEPVKGNTWGGTRPAHSPRRSSPVNSCYLSQPLGSRWS